MLRYKKIFPILFLLVFFLPSISICLSKDINSFNQAKKEARIIWVDHPQTVCCGCTFDTQLSVDHQSCGYEPKNNRANRVEWEHIVPASFFGKNRACWKKAACTRKNGDKYQGSDCCEKIDPQFREMYTDLHNLIPIIGEVNGVRKDYSFTNIPFHRQIQIGYFNQCKIFIDKANHNVEPKYEIKGLVARAHLYMAKTYAVTLEVEQEKVMQDWHQKYPPSEWEKEWNSKIYKITGKNNSLITDSFLTLVKLNLVD